MAQRIWETKYYYFTIQSNYTDKLIYTNIHTKKASVTPSSFFLLRNSDRKLRKLYFISRYALHWTLICRKNPQLMLEHLKMPGQATAQLAIQIQQHL